MNRSTAAFADGASTRGTATSYCPLHSARWVQRAQLAPGSRDVEPVLPGDANGDGQVNVDDLLIVISSWGPCQGCTADFNLDGMVGVDDLLTLLANWGA